MEILNKLISSGAALYYSREFRNMIEDHLQWILTQSTTHVITVEAGIAYKFAGDLEGVLRYYNVSNEYHWIAMRLNGMTSPSDYRDNMLQLRVANPEVIERLASGFLSQSKIRK